MNTGKPIIFILLMTQAFTAYALENYAMQRARMVGAIVEMTGDTSDYTGIESLSSRVIDAMRTVPRHEFVPESYREHAYVNRPLPIGNDQTISQPYIVALMTELAGVDADSVVLEVGTGSGYQAAVLAELAGHVYTIEIIEALGRTAQSVLERLGYENITVRIGDGYHGWEEAGPFDAILVTAAPEQVPQPLLDQLAPGGRMVIPVGSQGRAQSLRVIEKDAKGVVSERDVLPVGFVPLTREN
ncbi:MAG: protein-L-isoaspartate(D-aspartate) O-methyltransferase [Gammaproteobacteria bacterium]